jgi:protein-disulfide isomerase
MIGAKLRGPDSKAMDVGKIANIVVISLVVFALVRPSGPIGEKVVTWRAERHTRAMIDEKFPSIASGSRLDSSKAAPVALVEFSDYECPFCRKQHAALQTVIANARGTGVVMRHLPLTALHEHAEGAARAAICAERQGRFREMNDRLFGTDTWLKDSDWSREARAAGVKDLDAFSACLQSKETTSRLELDHAMANDLGIQGTPSFVYRGGVYVGMLSDTLFARLTHGSER